MTSAPQLPERANPPSAAALALAAGRPDISRSFRFHRPRGPFCGRGSCHQCPVRTANGSELACEIPGPIRTRRFDLLRPLGWRAERLRPWFYERQFRRPSWFRQRYLRTLRWLSSAPKLPAAPGPPRRQKLERVATQVLVVGGGRSGMRAATELASGGEALVLERTPTRAELPDVGRVIVRTSTTCLGLYPEEGVAAAVGPSGPIEIRYERLVVATGAYDAWLVFEGNDLPGILGLRGFERFAAQGAFARGPTIGAFAAPDDAERALAAATGFGLELAWLAGPADLPGTTRPSYPRTRIVRATGGRRVSSVELEGVGPLACDVLVLGFTQPTYELQAQAGIPLEVRGVPPRIRPTGARDDVLVVGEAASRPADVPPPTVVHPDAFVCPCEDVRTGDVQAAVAGGFAAIELVKRRTGASTGACQGRLCLAPLAGLLVELGLPEELPTARPPIVSVPLASIAADG